MYELAVLFWKYQTLQYGALMKSPIEENDNIVKVWMLT